MLNSKFPWSSPQKSLKENINDAALRFGWFELLDWVEYIYFLFLKKRKITKYK